MNKQHYVMIRTILAMFLIVALLFAVSGCSWIIQALDLPSTITEGSDTSSAGTEDVSDTESTFKPTMTPTPEPTPGSEIDRVSYTVKYGDTLYSIAVEHGVTVAWLTKINNISDPEKIYPEQVLIISAAALTSAPSRDNLNNTVQGWRFNVPNPLNQDVAATLSAAAAALVEKYDSVWQLVQKDKKVVYLTIDAGYEYGTNTTKILDIAADKNVKFTFFVTGSFINANPAVVMRMVNEGHKVGNHTERHLNQPKALDISLETLQNDVLIAEQRFLNLTGNSFAPYLRPPEGAYSERSLAMLKDMGYRAVFWSFGYADWQTNMQLEPDIAYEKIMGQLHNGSVLLLHTVSNTNIQILGRLIDSIQARGYSIEMLP